MLLEKFGYDPLIMEVCRLGLNNFFYTKDTEYYPKAIIDFYGHLQKEKNSHMMHIEYKLPRKRKKIFKISKHGLL